MSDAQLEVQLFDEDFDLTKLDGGQEGQQSQKPARGSRKRRNNSCGASAGTAGKTSASKPKEPDKDLERFVVLTNDNEQMTFPADMTLDEIRAKLEEEYPAYTKQNTNWTFEKQEDKGRYLCIPSYKFNKMG